MPQDSPDWHKEKITIDAAYGRERMALYLFLPAKIRPPYQTVAFSPSARVYGSNNSATLGDMKFIDFIIQSGRAVLYPIYKDTYERRDPTMVQSPLTARDTLIQQSKDLGRALDYAQSRADLDSKKFAFLGVSMGAASGIVMAAVENRLKAVILLDGGFFIEDALPATDQLDFAPRLTAPTLMLSGKYDWVFMGKDALLRLLGTPAADKKAVTFDTAHDVSEQRPDLIRETVAWLDKYLGRID